MATPPASPTQPPERPPASAAWPFAWLALGVVAFVVLGKSDEPVLAITSVAERWLRSGWPTMLYVIAAWGIGRTLTQRCFALAPESHTLWLSAGLVVMLTLSHGLPALGLMDLRRGLGVVAWLPIVVGCVLAALHVRRPRLLPVPGAWMSRWSWPGFGAAGMMLAAACSPPGVLWRSEFGGYDALSYHLELPKEWMSNGALATLPHNVYSALPSALEAAFLHIATLRMPALPPQGAGLLESAGAGLIAAQQLHALLAIAACLACGRVALAVAELLNTEPVMRARAAGVTFSLAALTPWIVVVGSLAYNEAPLLLALAAIVLVLVQAWRARSHSLSPLRTGLFVGALAGAATCVKPTALFFVGVPAGLLILLLLPRRAWALTLCAAAVAGAVLLAPWMARNVAATRNPVFPFAASVFPNAQGGTGHWSKEQVARFAAAHRFDGPLAQRARLMLAPDPSDPMGTTHRGLRHPQWGLLLLAACILTPALVLLRRPRAGHAPPPAGSRRTLALAALCVLGVQLVLWLFATHIQSRFLLPLLPIASVVCGVSLACIAKRRLASIAALLALAIQAGFLVATIRAEPRGAAVALLATPGDFMAFSPGAGDDAPPAPWVNARVPASDRVLLLGDAAPLYFRSDVAYATTWDTNPLAEAIAASPADDPASWTTALRAQGFSHVLIHAGELARLERSGFLDPRLSPDRLQRWAREHTTLLRAWPEQGQYLVELSPPAR